jgi:FkbM family methyltransferase
MFGLSKEIRNLNSSVLSLLYRILYHPAINFLIRSVMKAIPFWPVRWRIQPSGILPIPLSNGKIMKLCTNQTCHVTSVVFWEGSSAYEFTDIFLHLFSRSKVFFDVGSNIGYYAVMAGVTAPDLKVYAFDPSPGPFEFLQKNIELNACRNVKALQLALSDKEGMFSFHISYNLKYPYLGYRVLGGSGHLAHVRESPGLFKVNAECRTLDQFVEHNKIASIDLIKLDVEEAEHLVLSGGKKSLAAFRPIVVCEVFSVEMLDLILREILIGHYHCFLNEGNALYPFSQGQSLAIEKPENFFFVPEEKLDLISGFVR